MRQRLAESRHHDALELRRLSRRLEVLDQKELHAALDLDCLASVADPKERAKLIQAHNTTRLMVRRGHGQANRESVDRSLPPFAGGLVACTTLGVKVALCLELTCVANHPHDRRTMRSNWSNWQRSGARCLLASWMPLLLYMPTAPQDLQRGPSCSLHWEVRLGCAAVLVEDATWERFTPRCSHDALCGCVLMCVQLCFNAHATASTSNTDSSSGKHCEKLEHPPADR